MSLCASIFGLVFILLLILLRQVQQNLALHRNMACCCCFLFGIHTNSKIIISVKDHHYQALLANSAIAGGSDFPIAKFSPSYSDRANPRKQGGFADLLTLEKFSVQRSTDEIGSFVLFDVSGKEVCVILSQPSCHRNNDHIYSDNQGNELVRVAVECKAPDGSRQIGSIHYCFTCDCSSETVYGNTSDFHLDVRNDQNGMRFKSSKNNKEVGQVFITGMGANGYFPADLELGIKIALIEKAVDLIESEPHRRNSPY